MIFPKLLNMKYSGMSKGKVTMSMLRSIYDLILPSKEMAEAHEYAMRIGVIEAKFMNEAMTRVEGLFGRKELDKPFILVLPSGLITHKWFCKLFNNN